MFPQDSVVVNNLTVSECRQYVVELSKPEYAEQIKEIIEGRHPTYILFDRMAGNLLLGIIEQTRSQDVSVKDLFSRRCLPIVNRSSKVVPTIMDIPKDCPNATVIAGDISEVLARHYGAKSPVKKFKLELETMNGEKFVIQN